MFFLLALLLIPVLTFLLVLCMRKTGVVDGGEVVKRLDVEKNEEICHKTKNKAKTRERSLQQKLSVRISTPLGSSAKGRIQSIDGMSLEEFVVHVSSMHEDRDKQFNEEYEALPDQIEDFAIVAAFKPENALKNRYKNILPYEHSRIILNRQDAGDSEELVLSKSVKDGRRDKGFINANYISGYNKEREYIAAQGPLPETVGDFWWMVWQDNISQLIMACNLIENGRAKCTSYWPNDEGTSSDYDQIRVSLMHKRKTPYYITRTFSLSLIPTITPSGSFSSLTPTHPSDQIEGDVPPSAVARQLTHYQFTGWPDFGAPLTAGPLLALVRRVRSAVQPEDGPILVHCSAGVGRTGTFIMLDIMLQRMAIEGRVEVKRTVEALRGERGYMVQSLTQYIFLHDALAEAYICGVTVIPSHELASKCSQLTADTQLIEQMVIKLPDPTSFYTHPTAGDMANSGKNRDFSILPFQRTSVPLLQFKQEKGSFEISPKDSYINANFVQGYWLDHNFVVTQEPLPASTTDFWSMLLQQSSICVVALQASLSATDGSAFSLESGDSVVEQAYLPNEAGSELEFGFMRVKCLECVLKEEQYLVERKLLIKWGAREHHVTHYTFRFNTRLLTNYSEINTNTIALGAIRELVLFVNNIRSVYKKDRNTNPNLQRKRPILLYDKLGTNLCGIFCALFIGMDCIENEESFDLLQTCRDLCSQRPKIINSSGDFYLILQGLSVFQDEVRQRIY